MLWQYAMTTLFLVPTRLPEQWKYWVAAICAPPLLIVIFGLPPSQFRCRRECIPFEFYSSPWFSFQSQDSSSYFHTDFMVVTMIFIPLWIMSDCPPIGLPHRVVQRAHKHNLFLNLRIIFILISNYFKMAAVSTLVVLFLKNVWWNPVTVLRCIFSSYKKNN